MDTIIGAVPKATLVQTIEVRGCRAQREARDCMSGSVMVALMVTRE